MGHCSLLQILKKLLVPDENGKLTIGASNVSLLSSPAGPLHLDLCEGAVDPAEVLRRQFDVDRSKVLLQTFPLPRPGDRNDPRLLGEQPCQRGLGRCRIVPRRDTAEQIDDWLVGFAGLGGKAREPGPNVGGGEGYSGINRR